MVLVFIVSFSHSKTLAGLHAFVNVVEIPSQNNMVMKKNVKKQERIFLV